jgi:hypothetical protein
VAVPTGSSYDPALAWTATMFSSIAYGNPVWSSAAVCSTRSFGVHRQPFDHKGGVGGKGFGARAGGLDDLVPWRVVA